MKKIEDRIITFEEALELPEYADFHEVIQYLEKTPEKDVFPRKYEASIQGMTTRKVQVLFDENPSMPLKNVLALVIGYLPSDLSSKLLLKMTQVTIKKWEKLTGEVYSIKKTPQFA